MSDEPARPDYLVHEVDEKDVTVDWFFAPWRSLRPLGQLVLVLVGWFFVLLPMVITASALIYQDDPDRGWWNYREGFVMWRALVLVLAVLLVLFLVVFLVLHLVDRASARRRAKRTTYDEERLAKRMEVAADWYAEKFGPVELRQQQRKIRIEPHVDVETYELRRRYQTYEVD